MTWTEAFRKVPKIVMGFERAIVRTTQRTSKAVKPQEATRLTQDCLGMIGASQSSESEKESADQISSVFFSETKHGVVWCVVRACDATCAQVKNEKNEAKESTRQGKEMATEVRNGNFNIRLRTPRMTEALPPQLSLSLYELLQRTDGPLALACDLHAISLHMYPRRSVCLWCMYGIRAM